MSDKVDSASPSHGETPYRSHLYRDFTLTADNCDKEPIHRPVEVQGHGHLLVFDRSLKTTLYAISEPFAALIGHETQALWSTPFLQWLPDALGQLVSTTESGDYEPRSVGCILDIAGTAYQVTHHQYHGKLIIELEPEPDTRVDNDIISQAAQAFRQSVELESLYADACHWIAQAFEYDRVMIYQFDHDQHGCVVGEHKVESLEPYLGLHYPETDIPKIARDLFLLIRSRCIADVNIHHDPLVFNPATGANPPYLDLSYSQLRATSPIHIHYLQNMGVAASLTFAIIIQGKLWGLIACHHGSPRQVLFDHKRVGEALADLLAKRIFELEVSLQVEKESAARVVESQLLEQVILSDNYRVQILEEAAKIVDLCECDGAALVTHGQCSFSTGLVPSEQTLVAITNWLVSEGHHEVFSTAQFVQDFAVDTDDAKAVGGLLSACISTLSASFLLWFRHPVTQTTNWAGDPENSYRIEASEDGEGVRLSPRQSFAKWQVSVSGQSLRWDNSALAMADRVRQGIFRKELQYTAAIVERSNKEFMQLTFAAAHDLQEPLRTQTNYLGLLKESLVSEDYEETMHFTRRTENAADRMRELVADLLDYSRLGIVNKIQSVSLAGVVEAICEEQSVRLRESGTILDVGDLPVIRGDESKLKQLLRNLLTNAIKYVEPGVAPKISIVVEHEGAFCILKVKDNGIGIDPQYHEQIFVMFKRLHGKNEYEGSGIGLTICAKVAQSMGAQIGLTSAPGEGSVFWLRFHRSMIVQSS